MYTIDDFAMMEPMKYYNNEDGNNMKRQAMIDNKDDLYIATEKHDGDWGMFIHYSKGKNLIRSRSISKVTGVYGDYTAKLPHLCEEMDCWPDNTVILAEICWNEYGTNANTVGTILRCLPPKAVERQKNKKLFGLVFDILMIDGKDMMNEKYSDRILTVASFFNNILTDYEDNYEPKYFQMTKVIFNNFAEEADKIIANGGEGLVIQLKANPYMPGTRTAWKTLKLKQKLPEMELKVIGTIEPNKIYEGDFPEAWKYWEGLYINFDESGKTIMIDHTPTTADEGNSTIEWFPITKPYFYGWKNGIKVQLENGIITDITSGLTDADREWLASEEAAQKIANGELYAVIKAMSFNDLGKLRHGYLVRLRDDVIQEENTNE